MQRILFIQQNFSVTNNYDRCKKKNGFKWVKIQVNAYSWGKFHCKTKKKFDFIFLKRFFFARIIAKKNLSSRRKFPLHEVTEVLAFKSCQANVASLLPNLFPQQQC